MVKFLKSHYAFIIIFVLGLSISWPLLQSGYFSHQDDLHIIRLVEMRECYLDLQLPCRWVPDMGWGNGLPMFNFYGPLTYYIGAILSFGFGYIVSSKILFFIAIIGGSFGMYMLVNEIWGKYAGLTSSILYMFAPYKALDIYVRGALTEAMALTLVPFVLYFGYRAVVTDKKNYKLFVLTLFLFVITHNIMTIVFLPVIGLWMLYVLHDNTFKDFKYVVMSFVLAIGLSSFFLLPAFFEKDLVQTDSLTRFELDYRANFISVGQLFLDRVWGYGTSIPGPEGGMNFSIGWPHWILAFSSIFAIIFNKNKKGTLLATFCLLLFLFSIYMTHNKSTFIWEKISILTFFQFPWRFLSLSILTSSILGGFVVIILNEKFQKYVAFIIILITVVLNWSYFKPREFYNINDTEKTSGEVWQIQKKGAMLDYLPKTALEAREDAPTDPLVITGDAKITDFVNKSNNFKFKTVVTSRSQIDIPVYYFPNWEVFVNGNFFPSSHDNQLGRISINLEVGEYNVEGRFKNTQLRNFANVISLISAFVLIYIWKKR